MAYALHGLLQFSWGGGGGGRSCALHALNQWAELLLSTLPQFSWRNGVWLCMHSTSKQRWTHKDSYLWMELLMEERASTFASFGWRDNDVGLIALVCGLRIQIVLCACVCVCVCEGLNVCRACQALWQRRSPNTSAATGSPDERRSMYSTEGWAPTSCRSLDYGCRCRCRRCCCCCCCCRASSLPLFVFSFFGILLLLFFFFFRSRSAAPTPSLSFMAYIARHWVGVSHCSEGAGCGCCCGASWLSVAFCLLVYCRCWGFFPLSAPYQSFGGRESESCQQ